MTESSGLRNPARPKALTPGELTQGRKVIFYDYENGYDVYEIAHVIDEYVFLKSDQDSRTRDRTFAGLGASPNRSGEWDYSVFVLGIEDAEYLPSLNEKPRTRSLDLINDPDWLRESQINNYLIDRA